MHIRLNELIGSLQLGSKISCLFMEVGILLFYFHHMKNFIEVFFIYAMYMISICVMMLWLATAVIPSTDWIYNSHVMWIILFLLGLQTFAVIRGMIDKSGK
jgi:hypothetical protein